MDKLPVAISVQGVELECELSVPSAARGIVVFAHGSGSGRHNPRNRLVARYLNDAALGTLLVDLLTVEESAIDVQTAALRFNIALLARRLAALTDWLKRQDATAALPIGYFGASTGAAAALVAAAERPRDVAAVVSRGGRPDLARQALRRVVAPTLLLVGSNDPNTIELNRVALRSMTGHNTLEIVAGAGHRFEEPGRLLEVSRRSTRWFHDALDALLGHSVHV